MLRFFPLLALLGACSVNDKPTLSLGIDDKQNLGITLLRGDDHTFGTVHATANGIDAGAAVIEKGGEGIAFSQASSGASATWTIPMAQLQSDAVHVVVTEGSDTFSVDAPAIGAARAVQMQTSLAAPLSPGDRIEAATGVASDSVSGGFEIKAADGSSCTVQWDTKLLPGAVSLGLATPDNLQYDWWCGDYPAAGTTKSFTLDLDLWVAAAVTSCKGDDLTCETAGVPDLHLSSPIQITF